MEYAGHTALDTPTLRATASLPGASLAIDLEVDQIGCVFKVAAIRGDADAPFIWTHQRKDIPWHALAHYAQDACALVGHNCILHDIPFIQKYAPDLALLRLPIIDTLWLSPLAFPANPYHRLVKHYKGGGLIRETRNDPELDARICLQVFQDELEAFEKLHSDQPGLCLAYHGLCGRAYPGFALVFRSVRDAPMPGEAATREAVRTVLRGKACATAIRDLVDSERDALGWPLAYALAWISVAGERSAPPPWVRHQFPEVVSLIRQLRNVACGDERCPWCSERHDPRKVLQKYFGFDAYRPAPEWHDGRSMQEAIVATSMGGKHVLGILPTGTGKSICYQVPALAQYENTGALTVVISPLVALMEDQIRGLESKEIGSCVAMNGMLSMPERREVLERVRLGEVAILLLSPEQLRSPRVRRCLEQREIGAWVLDEAHCLSKWGHDFRTDYRYVATCIKALAGENPLPTILCLTATAKPDVIEDICRYFNDRLGVGLEVFNGGASRDNLHYAVVETSSASKLGMIISQLHEHLGDGQNGGAIIYRAKRQLTEKTARELVDAHWSAAYFHAGLAPEEKKEVQKRFLDGELKVIVATNAFGMGIDKSDVRLVLHADIPGSLECYVQEAGRAGRDGESAACVLLYVPDDVEGQFELSSRSRLRQHEIQTVLRLLRRMATLNERAGGGREVVVTAGEILVDALEDDFARDSYSEDTKVRTAVAWLEEAKLASRRENRYEVYPSLLQIATMSEANVLLERVASEAQRKAYTAMLQVLFHADTTEGVTTDELAAVAGINLDRVPGYLHDLTRLGLLADDAVFTARVHYGVTNASKDRLEKVSRLETALIQTLQEEAPDLEVESDAVLQLRKICQRLKDQGIDGEPTTVTRLLSNWSREGGVEKARGAIRLKKLDPENYRFGLRTPWDVLREQVRMRHVAARLLLTHLLATLKPSLRGKDLLAETTIGKLHDSVEQDAELCGPGIDIGDMVEKALLWLHHQEVIRLGKGMIIFRPAMTIQVPGSKESFNQEHFSELQRHYDEKVIQIHVMARYAQEAIKAQARAVTLMDDYFRLDKEVFIRRWFPKDANILKRQTTPNSWEKIISVLSPKQAEIVQDDREQTNVLVLAGPGSGKTRVLVHRIAYLIRMRREDPRKILALSYNRHAAVEIRSRLKALIGPDARQVTVLTCHALALRITGRHFGDKRVDDRDYDAWIREAVQLLQGEGLEAEEADAQRERLLAGFRWILVDEYQDIGPSQYALISAMAGKSLEDPGSRLSLFAVGDDDQNIYEFNGTSVEFIRRFQDDYKAKPAYLVENYRSTKHIIEASNGLIQRATERMKAAHPIEVDRQRRSDFPGGPWETIDPERQGRVAILEVAGGEAEQGLCAVDALRHLASLDANWDWKQCAVIARTWDLLGPVQCYCEYLGIPIHIARDETGYFLRLRETAALLAWLDEQTDALLPRDRVDEWLNQPGHVGPWFSLLKEALDEYQLGCGEQPLPPQHLKHWLAEWGRQVRRRPRGMTLTTAHGAKGLEFDHVVVLDGGWPANLGAKRRDADLRLYYVAMTRARETLMLMNIGGQNTLLRELSGACIYRQQVVASPELCPADFLQYFDTCPLEWVYLSHAGRFHDAHMIHEAIRYLEPGAPLNLQSVGFCPVLFDAKGVGVGRMSTKFTPRHDMEIAEVKVHAIISWSREDNKEESCHAGLQCDVWEVVVPTITYRRSESPSPESAG